MPNRPIPKPPPKLPGTVVEKVPTGGYVQGVGKLPAPYPGPKGLPVPGTSEWDKSVARSQRGTTSRAYATTHGAEKNMLPTADIQKWTDTQKWIDAAKANAANHPLGANNSGVHNRGGSIPGVIDQNPVDPISGAPSPIGLDLSQNPYGGAYDQLMAFVKQSIGSRGADYNATKATLQAQQEAANKGLYQSYLGSRLGADQSATALGVDPNVVSAARDLAMRKNQENSDQSLADNLAFVDKAKLLRGDQGNFTLNSLANDKLQKTQGWNDAETQRNFDMNARALDAYNKNLLATLQASVKSNGKTSKAGKAAAKAASAGAPTTTVTNTDSLPGGGADSLILQSFIDKGDLQGAADYTNAHLLASGNKDQKLVQGKINALANAAEFKPKPRTSFDILGAYANAAGKQTSLKAKTEQARYKNILDAMLPGSGVFGNPINKKTVTSKAKKKG